MRAISYLGLTLFVAGCGASAVPVRVLHTEVPQLQAPVATPEPAAPHGEVEPTTTAAPRIGAPGGSGAGSRRVLPL